MNAVGIMRLTLVGVGLLVAAASFWFHAAKKMTSDLATAWCLVGIVILVIGAVPVLSDWLGRISVWTGMALLISGSVGLWAAFRICLILSRLVTQNQELAMQVSLLLGTQQHPPVKPAATEETGEDSAHEESPVCH